ncbi:hypothetical protein [Candidatus Phycosocius bacilliformis]|nr:hypothetical protein [Candidatus Phycosocius bacilliformis]
MVRAILEGRKTQTRRLLKPQPRLFQIDEKGTPCQVGVIQVEGRAYNQLVLGNVIPSEPRLHSIGDTLWVQERWNIFMCSRDAEVSWPLKAIPETDPRNDEDEDGSQRHNIALDYSATFKEGGPWRPSIHMPRWASRISLLVTGVKVERLQDISESDVIAEGLTMTAKAAFEALWTSINGQASWDANPWVVAYSFERID